MKKPSCDVKGFKNKLKWYFSGYSHEIIVSNEDIGESYCSEVIENIVSNLRDRKYEHLVIDVENNKYLNFVQTAKYGKKFRFEYSVKCSDGKRHLYMLDELTERECLDWFNKILQIQGVDALPGKDITKEVFGMKFRHKNKKK